MVSLPPLSSNAAGLELLKSMWTEFAITVLVIAARFYTRVYLVCKVGVDDFIMIIAFLVNLSAFILNNLAVNNGFGLHQKDLAPELVIQVVKWAFLGQILGIMASAIARMAFIATLTLLLGPNQKLQLWLLRGFFVVQACINSITSLYILLQCRPTRGLWNHTIGAKCLPPIIQEHLGFSQASINSFTDLALAIFPATVIWKLNMRRSLKLQLCATMGLGIFACATSVVKTVKLTEISANPNDLTNIMWGIQFWFCIENCTLITAATVPTLRPLFARNRTDRGATSYNVSDQHSYQRWDGMWNKTKAPAGVGTSATSYFDDQIELTGANVGKFGIGYDAECAADAEGGKVGEHLEEPPKGGIMKTVNTYVET